MAKDKREQVTSRETRGFKTGGASAWITLTVCTLLFMVNYMDRQVLSAVMEPLKIELGLSDTQAGMLQAVFFLCIAFFSFPVARLVDRWSRRKAIGLMAIIWSAATWFTALGRSFLGVLLPRTVVGVGEAGFSSGGTAMITAAFPPEFRSRALGIFNMAMPLGATIGVILGGYLSANHGGWRTPFYFFAAPGVVLGLAAFFLRDYKTVKAEDEASSGIFRDAASLFKVPTMRWIFLGSGLHNVLITAVLAWTPALLMRTIHVAEDKAGMIMGMVGISAIAGMVIGGFLADWRQKKDPRGRLAVAVWSEPITVVFAVTGFILMSSSTFALSMTMLVIYGAASSVWLPGVNAATQEVVHPRYKGIAWGMSILFMYLFGAIGPALVGAVSDALGGGAGGLQTGIIILAATSLGAAFCFWKGARHYPSDMDAVKNIRLEAE